ncbi:hypothetical protein QCB45_02850 [Thiomicrorhabdus sp. ZW0627]|uniref:hypothetical protein n=1 Tax=Thiomicrorhabdus sp. ZW0627 TaxID=3039774 RepID=UPI002437282C|nr:hypothetical protein [Thiomicrorhabdus sp. ZW0627]MDG6773257.1 hypothetical protein [Thiomicrorhabdus sp. ZW0627]
MTEKSDGNITSFKPKEVEMMMSDWASPGNPTPYELRVTLQTCKRILQENYDALECEGCDLEKTKQNIKVLERNYMVLMDYLVDR